MRALSRRTLVRTTAAMSAAAVAAAPTAGARRSSRPNVLWIVTDDQPRATLPRMRTTRQALVATGAHFLHGYAAVPWCGPARASLLTSRYPSNHGCLTNSTHDPFVAGGHHQDTVAVRLRAAGYRTGYFGKYLNGMPLTYVAPGWERWVAHVGAMSRPDSVYNVDGRLRLTDGRDADRFAADRCRRFLEQRAGGPWFAVFAPTSPHDPYRPSEEHRHAFDDAWWRPASQNEVDLSDKPSWMRDLPARDVARMDRVWEGKLEELQDVDDQIAALLDTLRWTGQVANTYVFLVSDNGYLLGEHRLFKKQQPYEESAGIPFVVRGPGIAPGPREALVSQVDLMPTTLAAAGLDPDAGRVLDGRNLLPHLHTDDWTGWRARLLVEHPHEQWAMVCEGSTRFVDHYGAAEREMYDLATDQHQLSSYADTIDTSERAAIATALRQASGLALRQLEE